MFRFSDYFFARKIEYEPTSILFRDCVLRKSIGDFIVGSKFDTIQFMFIQMNLAFFDERGKCIMKLGFELCNLDV